MEQDQSSTAHPQEAHTEQSHPGLLRPGGSLPRVDSSASFVAEACHIEDVDAGCQIHSHPSDTGLARYTTVNGASDQDGEEVISETQRVQEYRQEFREDSTATEGWYPLMRFPRT